MADVIKEDPADVAGVAGDGDVGILLVDREGCAVKMRRSVVHHVVARAEIDGKIEVDRGRGKVAVDVGKPVAAHFERRLGVVGGVNGALVIEDRGVIFLAVPVEPVQIVTEADGGVIGAGVSDDVNGIALPVDLAALHRLLIGVGGDPEGLLERTVVGNHVVEGFGVFLNGGVGVLLSDVIGNRGEEHQTNAREHHQKSDDEQNFFPRFQLHDSLSLCDLRLLRCMRSTTVTVTAIKNPAIPRIAAR